MVEVFFLGIVNTLIFIFVAKPIHAIILFMGSGSSETLDY